MSRPPIKRETPDRIKIGRSEFVKWNWLKQQDVLGSTLKVLGTCVVFTYMAQQIQNPQSNKLIRKQELLI